MVQLDIISDPICPWCYIGKAQLDRAIAEVGVNPFDTHWRIFQLNPDMPPEGMDRREYLETKFGGPERAQQIYGRIADAAKGAGLDVALDKIGRTPNTMDAHRVIRWARTTGSQQGLVDDLFTRYFEKGEDISDHAVLLDAAEAAGMEREIVAKLLEGDADRESLAEEDRTAREMGVTGVPTFIVGGRYVLTGAQDAATWAKVIRELIASAEAREAGAGDSTASEGTTSGEATP
ncbi:MAG: DsbA family oxidoreductase [Pseudomonadota bacterium]